MTTQTVTPTAEQFLSQTSTPEDDTDLEQLEAWAPDWTADPLNLIAATLARIVDLTENGPAPACDHPDTERLQSLREAYADLESGQQSLLRLLEEIQEIVKTSTSKLAVSVKAAVDRWSGVGVETPEPPADPGTQPAPEPAPEPGTEPTDPALLDPTSLDSLRQHAASRGIPGAEQLNRSQLRTALGIPHPASEPNA